MGFLWKGIGTHKHGRLRNIRSTHSPRKISGAKQNSIVQKGPRTVAGIPYTSLYNGRGPPLHQPDTQKSNLITERRWQQETPNSTSLDGTIHMK